MKKISILILFLLAGIFILFIYNVYLLSTANNYYNQNNFALAEKYYGKLFLKNFYLKNYTLQLATIAEKEGHFKTAVNILIKSPQNTSAYYEHLCTDFYILNNLPRAINCQQKLEKISPNEKNIRYLAIFYFENEDLQKANNLLQQNIFFNSELKKIKNIVKQELKIKPQQKIIKQENFNMYYYSIYDETYAKEILSYLLSESKKLNFIFDDFINQKIIIKLVNDETFSAITGEGENNIVAATINNKLFIRTPRYSPLKSEINSTVIHEFVHLLIHLLTKKKPPLWINEGMAEYFSKDTLSSNEKEFFKLKINENNLLSFKQIQSNWNFEDTLNLNLAYIESYTLIEFFLSKFSFAVLKNLLIQQQLSNNFNEVFFSTTKVSLSEFLKEWLFFVKKKYS